VDNVRHMPRDQADQDGLTRTSPHDAEAENYVAGVIMHSRTAYLECSQVLDRDDIYQPAVRLIWDTVGGMVAEQKQLHPITVRGEIEKLKQLRLVDGAGSSTASAPRPSPRRWRRRSPSGSPTSRRSAATTSTPTGQSARSSSAPRPRNSTSSTTTTASTSSAAPPPATAPRT
jgi:hypothetical protein